MGRVVSFPDAPTPEQVLRFRESELCTAAQMWHADPESHAQWLHDCVERWQNALVAWDEVRRGQADH